MLSAQSEYFKAALRSPMKEATEKKFEYSEGSMHAHWRVIEYMYRGEYSEDPAQPLLPLGSSPCLARRSLTFHN